MLHPRAGQKPVFPWHVCGLNASDLSSYSPVHLDSQAPIHGFITTQTLPVEDKEKGLILSRLTSWPFFFICLFFEDFKDVPLIELVPTRVGSWQPVPHSVLNRMSL